MKYYGRTLLALATSAALLSACSDGTEGATTTDGTGSQTETAGSGLPSEDDVEAYFQAAAMYDVVALDRAVELAEEGSVAEAYATYLLGYANAAMDGGVPLSGSLVDRTADGYGSCDGGDCVTWGNIEGRDGKLVDFTVNGESLEERITAGIGERVAAGELAHVTMLSAYQSVTSGDLHVVAEVRSGDAPIKIGLYEATYRSPEGRESKAAEFVGPPSLAPGSMATVVVSFPNAAVGGVATVPVFSNDFEARREAVLPIR